MTYWRDFDKLMPYRSLRSFFGLPCRPRKLVLDLFEKWRVLMESVLGCISHSCGKIYWPEMLMFLFCDPEYPHYPAGYVCQRVTFHDCKWCSLRLLAANYWLKTGTLFRYKNSLPEILVFLHVETLITTFLFCLSVNITVVGNKH